MFINQYLKNRATLSKDCYLAFSYWTLGLNKNSKLDVVIGKHRMFIYALGATPVCGPYVSAFYVFKKVVDVYPNSKDIRWFIGSL